VDLRLGRHRDGQGPARPQRGAGMNYGGLSPSELTEEGLAALGAGNACDREPVHLSGAIQPHGFLLGVDPSSLTVTAASANVPHLVGCAAEPLGLALGDVLGPDVARSVQLMKPTGNPHDGLPMTFQLARSGTDTLSVKMVAHQRGPVLLLEFEESSDAERDGSAFNHVLRDAMKALLNVDEVEEICRLTVREVRRLTGYDRVMVYRFEPDAHGHVIAEDRREKSEPFLGLHYPAGDIPRQARALYLRNWIRLIADVDYDPVAIAGLAGSVTVDQLDLSMSVLRSVSPVHLRYLRNMGVSATMTISLVVEGKLWGLIACHHDSAKLIGPVQRLAFETLGQLVAVRLQAAESLSVQARVRDLGRLAADVVTGMAAGENPAAGAAIASEPLLAMAEADGAVVEIDGVRITAGAVPSPEVVDGLVAELSKLAGAGVTPLVTDALSELVALPMEPQASAAGALFVPLAGRSPGFVMWLRGERRQTVRWAGRPETKLNDDDAEDQFVALTPRASFAEWRETVRGHSLPWGAGEIAAATELAQAMPGVLLHRAQNRLVGLALHDSLTGLPNRACLIDQMSSLLSTRGPASGGPTGIGDPGAAVLFVDIDGFKAINDTQGHLIGDELLTLAARRISEAVRPQDTVARLGGDEFVVLVPDVDAHTAVGIAQRVVEVFRKSFLAADAARRSLTLSVGVAVVAAGTDPGEALRQADSAMYHAKRSGRDQVSVYHPGSGATTGSQQLAGDVLGDAITSDQITAHYQPILALNADTNTPLLVGFEALARWKHPVRGLLEADTFIALAEGTELVHALGDEVLRQALLQLRTWADQRLTMAVNVSVTQLVRPGYASHVVSQLAELGIAPGRLCLEITESSMMQQPDLALAVLSELHAAEVSIAIDDFGIGYSSLAYVRNLPATLLKIDQMFVSELPDSAKDSAVIAATVTLAHSLGMRTVAEGVETDEQVDHLRKLGSDFVQGYLLGRPAAGQDVRLENWTMVSQ
jgi:diguanylate cyclase (GGDEF)-like protein